MLLNINFEELLVKRKCTAWKNLLSLESWTVLAAPGRAVWQQCMQMDDLKQRHCKSNVPVSQVQCRAAKAERAVNPRVFLKVQSTVPCSKGFKIMVSIILKDFPFSILLFFSCWYSL